MARGRRLKNKIFKKVKEYEEKIKQDQIKAEISIQKPEDRALSRANSYFKSEEIQEICGLLNIEELGDQQCFLGAVVIGKFDVVKKLLKDGYSINSVDENKESGLVHAVKHCRLEMVEFLLNRGANPTLADREGNTALLLAAQTTLWDQDSFLGLWRSVRDNPHLDPSLDHANKAGYSLVHYVTKRQWQTALELLLEARVQLDCYTNKGVTPLIMAASRGDAAFTAALLQAGADFTLEDQQKCTALCYAIAFSLQKSVSEPNRAVELLLTATNEENSKMSLEVYLQRRLDLLVSPPRSAAQFSKTVSTVIAPVLSFFTQILYSGIDLLLQLNVFHRLREGLERHLEDQALTLALLGVCIELVRHCDCCSQELSQADLADAFFAANLGKSSLDILQRYGMSKAGVMKRVFLVLAYVCSSESVVAQAWLQASHAQLQPHFTKYMRSSPTLYSITPDTETAGAANTHLQHERRCALTFQRMMKALKNQGRLHTAHRDQHDATLSHSLYTVMKPDPVNICFKSLPENKAQVNCISKLKPAAVYNAMTQYNFGKLDIIHVTKYSHSKDVQKLADCKTDSHSNLDFPEKDCKRKRKPRMAIKEIQQNLILTNHSNREKKTDQNKQNNDIESKQLNSCLTNTERGTLPGISDSCNNKGTPIKHVAKERFSEGYQLFNMGNESLSESEEESETCRKTCEWLDSYSLTDGTNKNVSEKEVEDTINYLEEIFDRIVKRYDSTWKKQYEEGYLGAQGDAEDLLKLMTVLPALEEYHMKKLKTKWKNFCRKVKDHASKSHIIYAAMVSEMQLFLLEFEAELDQRNIKIFNDTENSSSESYIDTERVLVNLKYNNDSKLSSGKPVEYLINKNIETNKTGTNREIGVNCTDSKNNIHNSSLKLESSTQANSELLQNIYLSDSEEDEIEINIWDAKSKEHVNLEVNHKTPQECEQPEKNISLFNEDNESEISQNEASKDVTNIESLENETNECKQCNEVISNGYSQNKDVVEDKSVFNSQLETVMEKCYQNSSKHKESNRENNKNWQSKPPPGFENVHLLNTTSERLRSTFTFCGKKYETLTEALATLPACKTELLDDGRLRLASIEFQADFKLFNGYNFGDVELGLNGAGMPLAVRRFQKHTMPCNEAVSAGLVCAVSSVLQLRHANLLPYVACLDRPQAVVVAAPLCHQDLGQHIRQIRAAVATSPLTVTTVAPYLITMAYQLMSGLHYLHTLDTPVVHGNLKPSNVMVDTSGALRLAEFGLAQVLFQQRGPALTSMIWWSRDCLVPYYNTWKWVCTQQSDIQSAGMLVHFILTIGEHPYGQSLTNIIENIKNGVVLMRSSDVIATDLIYWMLSHDPTKRPTTYDALRHVLFWTTSRRWEFLLTCCGLGSKKDTFPLPLKSLYTDLDILGQLRDVNTNWISILKQNCERKIGTCIFEDNPSGLLNFLKKNLNNWIEVKDIFLELFPVLPLNLFRLIEQTSWIDHPVFEPFTRVDPLS